MGAEPHFIVKRVHHFTEYTPCCPTTWRSYCIALWRHFTLCIVLELQYCNFVIVQFVPMWLKRTEHIFTLNPCIEPVQALADISHSALCCYSNKTRALIANPVNGAQPEGTPTIPPSYIRVRAVVWERGEGQTDTSAVTNIHFASAAPHAKCN